MKSESLALLRSYWIAQKNPWSVPEKKHTTCKMEKISQEPLIIYNVEDDEPSYELMTREAEVAMEYFELEDQARILSQKFKKPTLQMINICMVSLITKGPIRK